MSETLKLRRMSKLRKMHFNNHTLSCREVIAKILNDISNVIETTPDKLSEARLAWSNIKTEKLKWRIFKTRRPKKGSTTVYKEGISHFGTMPAISGEGIMSITYNPMSHWFLSYKLRKVEKQNRSNRIWNQKVKRRNVTKHFFRLGNNSSSTQTYFIYVTT